MPDQELEKYIIAARAAGQSKEKIMAELLSAGWPAEQVAAAFVAPRGALASEKSWPSFWTLCMESWAIFRKHYISFAVVSAIPAVISSTML